MNDYKAHNKTLVHHCNKINKSIQVIMDGFTFHLCHKSFILDDVKLAELSNNSFD